MPIPFFTVVYKGENGDGMKHLVDLEHSGRAQLLTSYYDEEPSDPWVGPFCSGHWTNRLYRFHDLAMEEVRGQTGGFSFPFVHEWTYRGSLCEKREEPNPDVPPAAIPDAIDKQVSTKIRGPMDAVGIFQIDPVAGCTEARTNIIVYDQPSIREISFPTLFGPYPADLLEKIRRAGAKVELRGVSQGSPCGAKSVWAQ